ncbi:MAG: membrane protein insertase YidC, partial [Pseudomonadota bacterium]
MADNRNMFLAVGLSLAVILIWQFVFIQPQMEAEREAQQRQAELAAQQNPGAEGGVSAVPTPGAPSAIPQAPQATTGAPSALPSVPGTATAPAPQNASQRVIIDTPRVDGSLRLTGARIDDLMLKDYHVTVDPQSPEVRLLSPTGTANPYFVETGWVAAAGSGVAVPDSNTPWTLESGSQLTPETPITLVYDTGEGVIYRRTIEVDENYLFTVRQSIVNNTDAELTLFPYSRVRRQNLTDLVGFFILHEGVVGFDGAELFLLDYDDMTDADIDPVERARLERYGVEQAGWIGFTDKYWMTTLIPPS